LRPTRGSEIGKECGRCLTANISEGVAVEKKEGSGTMTVTKKIDYFNKGEGLWLPFLPLSRDFFLSFSIKTVLRSSSFTRSSIEVDDKLPTPVFEKFGSGL
jgi:hypothetical protein